ncbi:MAG: tRNA 2-thiouridine(34) synthase MnmA [Candidatus Omnitrophota bacterium]
MRKKERKSIVVGMSGGVDSSMALVLLKEKGWDPVGVSLKYPVWKDEANCLRENVCCSTESFQIAENVCKKLGVPYHVFDVSRDFKKEVIDYFLDRLRDHKTPNPCVMCNRYLKFKKLLEWAKRHDIDHVATGHYARVRKNPKTRKFELLEGKDLEKDQTYSLSFLSQEQLRHITLPLGGYTKQEIYKMAEDHGFEIFLKRKQSQDFCFVSGNAMEPFLAKEIGRNEGEVRDDSGHVIGKHQGLHFYTVGQRKGLGFSGGPFFVTGSDVRCNVLKVTRDEKNLLSREVFLSPCNFIGGMPKRSLRVKAKIRYRQAAAPGRLQPLGGNKAKIVFDKPQRAVTPGQFAVLYQRNVCLGAGEILPSGFRPRV